MSDLELAENLVRIGKFVVISTMCYVVIVLVLAARGGGGGEQ